MVTKRARRWLARGTLVTCLTVVAVLGTATWVTSSTIAEHLLAQPPAEGTTLVLAVRPAEVVLARTDRAAAPGRWAIRSATGFADLGEVLADDGVTVTRRVLRSDGILTTGMTVAVTRAVFGADPTARGLAFTEVLLAGPDGDLPAWVVTGGDDTWVVYVCDAGMGPEESLRVLGVAARLGLPVVVPLPVEATATDLGSLRWHEVDAAIGHALAAGAEEIVLIGSGTGASAAAIAARDSRYASRIVGLVFDGALLDPGSVADRRLAREQAPGFLLGWAKAMAAFRRGIDWAALDHTRTAAAQELPVLLFHGDGDDRFPLDAARAFADAAPDARLVTVAGAGHGEAWNADPGAYESALEGFLRDVAVGSSGRGAYAG